MDRTAGSFLATRSSRHGRADKRSWVSAGWRTWQIIPLLLSACYVWLIRYLSA